MQFRILGPLEVAAGAERLDLGGDRQQIVLAMLLLSADGVVSTARLLEAIYGEELPPTARSQVQISVSSLRRLFAAHGHAAVITTRDQGYVIDDGGRLDSRRFEERAAAAAAARDAGLLEQAVAEYHDALRLWRGPALDGLDSSLVRVAAARLDEQRITLNEDRLALELDLGRHRELAGELAELVEAFPLRERLRGQLMLALYRCDRVAEALAAYRQARQTMIDELGIEPGERLQQLQRAILNCDPALDPPAGPVSLQPVTRQAPWLLPADIADFTGRAEQIAEVRRRLLDAADETRLAVPVVVVAGKAGVGKTSLAVHVSHGAADHFPDGQLFADLHGGGPHPIGPTRVLERFLRLLGVPGAQIPPGLDERAEAYRNLLAGRKMLLVLDDALSESQVAPLLPGHGTAAVLITSRRRLTGLAGASRIDLGVFAADTSVDLLARIVGAGRVHEQSEAAAAVASRCGHLPLALRIAGARLSARPHWSIQQMADRLTDETRRLDELRHGDMAVRASISLSYEGASDQARQLFRRLGLLDQPVFSGWLSAALLDQPASEAEELLDDLVTAQLVENTGTASSAHSQYRFHDLIRVFARERLAAEEPAAVRKAALQRALGALLYLVDQARRRYRGGVQLLPISDDARWPLPADLTEQLVADPLSWLEHQRGALVSGVRQAARAGLTELSWSLVRSAEDFFESRAYYDDWRQATDIALQAAVESGDVHGQAAMLSSSGRVHLNQQRYGQARRDLDAAAELFQDAGDEVGFAVVIHLLAQLDQLSGRLDDATRRLQQALAVFRSTGQLVAAAYVLHVLAQVKLERREPEAATELLAEALRLTRAGQNRRTEAQVLHRIGQARLLLGEPSRAVGAFDQALTLARELGDPVGEAWVLQDLGVAQVRLGELGQARGVLQRALALARSVGDRLAEARALLGLTELTLASGELAQAVAHARRAAQLSREIGAPVYEGRALTLLQNARAALADTGTALGGADPGDGRASGPQ